MEVYRQAQALVQRGESTVLPMETWVFSTAIPLKRAAGLVTLTTTQASATYEITHAMASFKPASAVANTPITPGTTISI